MIALHNFTEATPAETLIRLAIKEAKTAKCEAPGCRHPAAMETQFGMLCMNDAIRAVQQARAAARQEGE